MGILCCAPGCRGFLRRGRRRGKNRYWPRGAQDGTVQAGRGPTIAFPCCECEVAAEEAARGLNGPRDHKASQLPPAAASATLAGLQPLEPQAEGTGRCHKMGCRGCRGHRSIEGSARWALRLVALWSLSPRQGSGIYGNKTPLPTAPGRWDWAKGLQPLDTNILAYFSPPPDPKKR